MNLPYLTRDLPGVGGLIKQRIEDFFVQEIPLYEPSGAGEHVFLEIQKINITTFEAINRIAKSLKISARDIGYAGLKDAHAVTRQVLSISGIDPRRLSALSLTDIQVQWVMPHTNKLRRGHLRGNRFAIKLREVRPTDVVKLPAIFRVLERRGMPNYFGPQRFGRRGDNAVCGELLLRDDAPGLLRQLLGNPNPATDDDDAVRARQAFDEGDLARALETYPRYYGMERSLLSRYMKTSDARATVAAVDQKIQQLWISALQSRVFNQVLARRIDTLDHLLAGDFAMKQDSGGCFLVQDLAAEQPRCERFEISPTGPMIGYRMDSPTAEAGEIESNVLSEHGLRAEQFRESGRLKVKGTRRPLRVKPTDVSYSAGVDEHGPHITLAFTLPAGAYATALIREISKTDALAGTDDTE